MSWFQDVKLAIRMFFTSPGFTAVAVTALALGIGVNSTVFTFVNAVLLRGLPFEDAHRVMHLENTNLSKGVESIEVSYADYLDWHRQNDSFEALGAADTGTMNLSDADHTPERVSGAWVTANTFPLLGQDPLIGRNFLPGEDEPSAEPVVMLSFGVWQSRYGGDPSILGKTLRVNEVACTVIGVMPEGMKFPFNADMWRPIDFSSEQREQRDRRRLEVYGKLKNETSLAQARVEMTSIVSRLESEYPDTNEDIGVAVKPYNDEFNGGEIKLLFLTLMGAVGFVLLIACANVANLLLARSAHRAREISIRASLGASRWRVIRQLLTESVLLGSAGGLVGLLLSLWGIRAFEQAVADVNKPYWIDFSLDLTVVAFFVVVCFATGILFGLAPALHLSKTAIAETLKEGSRGQAGGFRIKRATSALMVAELALTIILLVGAGLLARSFLNIQNLDFGVETRDRLTMRLALAEAKYPDDAARLAFSERLERELGALGGVRSVAFTSALPMQGAGARSVEIEGYALVDDEPPPAVTTVTVSSSYFETMGVPIRIGRHFRPSDGEPGTEVVIVNTEFAEKYWPGESPLSRRLRFGGDEPSDWMHVVGVISSIRQGDLNRIHPAVYVPYRQNPVRFVTVIAHSDLPPESLTRTLRENVQAVDPDLPVYQVATMDELLEELSWGFQVFSSMFVIFALIALVLSSVGLYAITAFGVSRRTQEFGIRLAFGAANTDIIRLAVGQGLKQLALGLGLGMLGAVAVTRILSTLLVQITPTDPLTFISIALILLAVAILAFIIPARRACNVSPVIALRDE